MPRPILRHMDLSTGGVSMKKIALATGLLALIAFVPTEAHAEEWREFTYHWTDVDGDRRTPMHIKFKFEQDGRWQGDFDVEQWPCQTNKDTCAVGAVIVVRAHNGVWFYMQNVGEASKAHGYHWHREGKSDMIKKHFPAMFDKNAKGEFTTTSHYRWKTHGVKNGINVDELLGDLKTALQVVGTAAAIFL